MMELPKEKSKINLDYKVQKLGMIGRSGIGKSSFFAQDDKAFFIEAEAGLNFLEVFKMPARCWDDLRNVYALLKEAEQKGNFPYSIVVVDTIDRIVDFAEEEIVARAKDFYRKIADQINTIGEVPNGAGWFKTRELVMNLFNKLETLPCAVAYIGHLSTKRRKEGVREFDINTISLWAGIANDMLAWCDHLLHIETHMMGDKLTRTVYTKPTQSREAKSRGGICPDGMAWTADDKENYKQFRGLFK